jgi:hypothetical protein
MGFESASHRERIDLVDNADQRMAEKVTGVASKQLPVRRELEGNFDKVSKGIRKLLRGKVLLASEDNFIIGASDPEEMDSLISALVERGAKNPPVKKLEEMNL